MKTTDRLAQAREKLATAREKARAAEEAVREAQKAASQAVAELVRAQVEVEVLEERTRGEERLEKAREKAHQEKAEALKKERARCKERLEKAKARTKKVSLRTSWAVPGDEPAEVPPEQWATVKRILRGRYEGLLSPLDGDEAVAVLSALDVGGNVSDKFTLTVGVGAGTYRVHFEVREEGLAFKVGR